MLVLLQAPKRYQNGEKIRVHSESHEILEIDVYLRLADTRIVHEGVLEQAGGAKQHVTGGAKRAETWRGWIK